ncbi:amylo-alpha-1,6-glucosidase [Clostridium perfringens]|uniref:amylo-alpha-1,6-glucosidase n=1 Tax=Clostridium perfringens TaxID=1502 RepID=UPI001F064D38|nr:amylo-alpha-1,6-glucosidase [Clostridium perfringens]MCH1963963.1 amylo-alpha-1,6-glucosidase [Clostridium perfringens]MDK0978428.1 amylo-alpha-1,6-glucosidase [Clostridium perfringens]
MKFGKKDWTNYDRGIEKEWMLTNGISGFCGGTAIGANCRKYQGLLVACTNSPEERYMILSNLNEEININGKLHQLSSCKYTDKIVDGFKNLQGFYYDGLPHFRFFVDGVVINKKIAMEYGKNTVVIEYDILNGSKESKIKIEPLFTFRNPGVCSGEENLKFSKTVDKNKIQLIPQLNEDINIRFFTYGGKIVDKSEKIVDKIYYDVDKSTGDKFVDKCYIPGTVEINLNPKERKKVYLLCTIENEESFDCEKIIENEEKRINSLKNTFDDSRILAKYLPIAGDQFIVNRESINGKTILAGYPWFLDWGRDAMIAINGLTLSTGRLEDAKDIIRSFSLYEKDGLIPNMFPGEGKEPLYNTVDASLWFINAVYNYLLYANSDEALEFVEKEVYGTIKNIIKAYKEGTEFSIKMDEEDSLINAGSGLDQVTWMDVRVNGIVVTPRHGKPVEINALWYNALKIAALLKDKFEKEEKNEYEELAQKVKSSFTNAFWNEDGKYLYDVVNDHEKDHSLRPNQIWAVSLPFTMLDREKEKYIVQKVFEELYTPYGLRSLSRDHKDYHGIYIGKLFDRDMAYHQGTTWAFPLGGFFTAYCKVNDYSKESVELVDSLMSDMEDHIQDQCLGSIAEIFDGDNPYRARGCYSQAWSVGEMLRVYYEDILGNHKKLKKVHKDIFI